MDVEFQCAIVLGAKVLEDGSPSPALARRVAHATALVQAGKVENLLMSGGPVSHPVPEAHVMRDLAIAAGIAPHRIFLEDSSRNTIDNARLSAPILTERGWTRLLLVTDSFHLPRARLIFRAHGVAVTTSGARPDQASAEWVLAHLREVPAMMKTIYKLIMQRHH